MKLIRHKKITKDCHKITNPKLLNIHLFAKVHEELQEIYESNFSDPTEFADAIQALYDLATVNNLSLTNIHDLRLSKERKFGNFTKGYLKL